MSHAPILDTLVNSEQTSQAAALAYDQQLRAGLDAQTGHVAGLSIQHWVEAIGRCGNRRPRVQKLVSAWNHGIRDDAASEGEADDALIGASAEPKKRPRTRLTDSEVDAMRTAREHGMRVIALAKKFDVHRGTVWAKTR